MRGIFTKAVLSLMLVASVYAQTDTHTQTHTTVIKKRGDSQDSGLQVKSIRTLKALMNKPGIEIEVQGSKSFYVGGLDYCLQIGNFPVGGPHHRSSDNLTLTFTLSTKAWKKLKNGDPIFLSWGCVGSSIRASITPFAYLNKKMLDKK